MPIEACVFLEMKTKFFSRACVALALLCVSTAWATDTKTNGMLDRDPFNYKGKSFTWTDKDGKSHNSLLTDKATSTDAIMGLLKEVYCNKAIPGTWYAYNYGGVTKWALPYSDITMSWWNRPASEIVERPTENYSTVMLIQLKESWNPTPTESFFGAEEWMYEITGDMFTHNRYTFINTLDGRKRFLVNDSYNDAYNYYNKTIESAQVIEKSKYINDANNPGFLYQVDNLQASRFFFFSKGRTAGMVDMVTSGEYVPLEFQIQATYDDGTPVLDGNGNPIVVDQFESYGICRPAYNMFESLGPRTQIIPSSSFIDDLLQGDTYKLNHDCASITLTAHYFTNSVNGVARKVPNLCLYVPDRRYEGGATEGVLLTDYNKNLTDKKYVPFIFAYDAELSASAAPSATNAPSQDAKNVANADHGSYTVTLNWFTSLEDQIGFNVPEQYTVYIVDPATGTRTPLSTVADIEDNTRDLTYSYDEAIQEEPRDIYYEVVANIINSEISRETAIRKVTIPGYGKSLQVSGEYRSSYDVANEVNRYKNSIDITSAASIAPGTYNVTRTSSEGDAVVVASITVTANGTYTVAYGNQETSNRFDNTEAPTSGRVDNGISVVDYFNASTAANEHPDGYTYTVSLGSIEQSNEFVVPVYKTDYTLTAQGVSMNDVLSDDNRTASTEWGNKTVTLSAINNDAAGINNYSVIRDGEDGTAVTGRADNLGHGSYNIVTNNNTAGTIHTVMGVTTIEGATGALSITDYKSSNESNDAYVPVINTVFNGDASKANSYGSNKETVTEPQVAVTISNAIKTNPFQGTDGMEMAFGATVNVTANLSGSIDNVYYYRVWRVDENGNEVLLNNLDDKSGNNWDMATSYSKIKNAYPEADTETTIGDTHTATIAINDIFTGDVLADGASKTVKYIVRMYSTSVDEGSSEGSEGGLDYFVSETEAVVVFNNGIPTGLDQLAASSAVESVKYYNMVGMESNRPFKGVNMVVTRYADGKVVTRKITK